MATEVKIADFKSHLSEHLRSVRNGQEIIVKDRQTPIARVVPYTQPRKRLVTIPPTRSLKELDRISVSRPKKLRPGDVDRALRWVRSDRL